MVFDFPTVGASVTVMWADPTFVRNPNIIGVSKDNAVELTSAPGWGFRFKALRYADEATWINVAYDVGTGLVDGNQFQPPQNHCVAIDNEPRTIATGISGAVLRLILTGFFHRDNESPYYQDMQAADPVDKGRYYEVVFSAKGNRNTFIAVYKTQSTQGDLIQLDPKWPP